MSSRCASSPAAPRRFCASTRARFPFIQSARGTGRHSHRMNKLTPNLIVDDIEACLPFWTSLGFTKTVEVPDGDRLGFVILVNAPVELMLQTRASVAKDVAPL